MHCIPLKFDLSNEFEFHELTQNMRQKDDIVFFDIFSRIRIGNPSENDIELLKQRKIKINDSTNKINECVKLFLEELKQNKNCVCLLPLTKNVIEFNSLVSQSLKIETIDLLAEDSKYNKRIKKT